MKKTTLVVALLVFTIFSATQKQSQHLIDSLTPLLEKVSKKDTQYIDILNELAKQNVHLEVEQTYHFAKEALKLSQKKKYKKGESLAYKNLGNFYLQNARYVEALDHYYKAKLLFIELGNKHDQAVVTNNSGIILRRQERYDEAITNYKEALNLYRETKNKEYQATSILSLGVAFRYKEEYDSALFYYGQCLELALEIDDRRTISKSYNNISLIHSYRNEFDSALVYAEKSVRIKQALKQNRLIASGFNTMARLYINIKDFKTAELYCDSALIYALQSSDRKTLQDIYDNQGSIYSELNKYEKAYHALKLSSDLKDSIFNADKSRAIGKLEAGYEIEKNIKEKEMQQKALEEQQKKRALVQYSCIFIFVLALFFSLFLMGNFQLPGGIANKTIILSILLLFEFLLLLTDPLLGTFLNGQPALILLVNFIFAVVFIPLDELLRRNLEKKLIKEKSNKAS